MASSFYTFYGNQGETGQDLIDRLTQVTTAYELWIELGNTGTMQDYLDSLVGPAGQGVPTGGTAGQVLSKINETNFNTQWVTLSGGGGGIVLGGTATINITKPAGVFEWRETITAAGVSGTSRVQLWLAPEDNTLENSPEMLDFVLLSGTPGTGTIDVIATFNNPTSGPINIIWSVI
jgi:hypothetical protein